MSASENLSGPAEEREPNEEPDGDEGQDDRWAFSFRMSPETIIRTLHLRPDETAPDWFEVCPLCGGAGCFACDDEGKLHPVRCGWLENYLMDLAVEDHNGQLRLPLRVIKELEQARAGQLRRSDVAAVPPGKRVL